MPLRSLVKLAGNFVVVVKMSLLSKSLSLSRFTPKKSFQPRANPCQPFEAD